MRTPFLQLPCWDSHLPGHKHPYHLPGPDWKGWQECWEVPQNQPHVPRRLRLCLRSSSGAEPHPIAYVSKLKQTLKPIKCILVDWTKGKCGAFLLSFAFLLFQYSVFIFGREGLFYSVFGLESAALTVNFLWFIPGIWPALCGFPHQSGIPPCFLKSLRNIWGVRLRKPAVKGCTIYSCPQVTHWESWLELWGKRSQVIPTSWLSK